ncbi:hypothetical protein RintRC_0835 [Richelia intracellularis]|nr:hypothetical protein RintRC_0835 [Richelia intracellularis]
MSPEQQSLLLGTLMDLAWQIIFTCKKQLYLRSILLLNQKLQVQL